MMATKITLLRVIFLLVLGLSQSSLITRQIWKISLGRFYKLKVTPTGCRQDSIHSNHDTMPVPTNCNTRLGLDKLKINPPGDKYLLQAKMMESSMHCPCPKGSEIQNQISKFVKILRYCTTLLYLLLWFDEKNSWNWNCNFAKMKGILQQKLTIFMHVFRFDLSVVPSKFDGQFWHWKIFKHK